MKAENNQPSITPTPDYNNDNKLKIPNNPAEFKVAIDGFSGKNEQLFYLCQLVKSKKISDQIRVLAIEYLGGYKDKEAVRVLLSNLDFLGNLTLPPARASLIKIGEFAIPQLLQYIEDSTSSSNQHTAANIISDIKGSPSAYADFMDECKKNSSQKVFEILTQASNP